MCAGCVGTAQNLRRLSAGVVRPPRHCGCASAPRQTPAGRRGAGAGGGADLFAPPILSPDSQEGEEAGSEVRGPEQGAAGACALGSAHNTGACWCAHTALCMHRAGETSQGFGIPRQGADRVRMLLQLRQSQVSSCRRPCFARKLCQRSLELGM